MVGRQAHVKAWTAGTICAKIEGFFIKKPERGGRTTGSILPEFNVFLQNAGIYLIWAVRPADRTAEDSQRHGHAGCPPFGV